jgi:LuxR family maltose regulon positive regulatory protein
VPLRAQALLGQGWLALWQGRLGEAATLLERADADAQWTGQLVITRNHALSMHACLDTLAGRREQALQAMHTRLAEFPASYGDWGLWHTLFSCTRLAASMGEMAIAREWLQRLHALEPSLPDAEAARLAPTRALGATMAALAGRVDEAIGGWRAALAEEESIDLLGQANEVRVRLAWALASGGGPGALREAAGLLEPMLARLADGPGGALFAAAALAGLAATDWQAALSPEQRATLQRWAAALAPAATAGRTPAHARAVAMLQPPVPSTAPATDDELLSAREREVLALIAHGDSNKLIARALDLSPHTVKRHVANILDKLALASRGQAAAWYHSHPPAALKAR